MKKKKWNLSGVTPETWARTIFLLVSLANQVLAVLGRGQIELTESQIYQAVSLIALIVSAIMAGWKNNSYTVSAQAGDVTMHAVEEQAAAGDPEYIEKADPHTTDHYHGAG